MSTPTKFVTDVRKKAKANDIKVKLVNKSVVYAPDDPFGVSGYFDEESGVLCVSTARDEATYYALLAHESSHMDQFIHDKYLWEKCNPGYTIFFEWLDGSIVKREILDEAVQDIIRIELDCERRAIKKIIQYDLPVDVEHYIRGVNAYLYGYLFALETKKWTPQIYFNDKVIAASSSKLKKNYSKIPHRLYSVFKREFKAV